MSEGERANVSAIITGDVSGQIAVGNGINQNWIAQPSEESSKSSLPSELTDVKVFISYRRDDAEGHAGRMRDWLLRRFGEDGVFQDVDGIEPGQDFVDRLEQKLAECDVLLAVIGQHWLTVNDNFGRRRIDDERDWVRLEIQMALERAVPVIPVLVAGARMPSEADLPPSLALLARRQAIAIGSQWAADVARLGDAIEGVTKRASPRR